MSESRRFAFRVDASSIIGSGHVMRCLTLADALATRGGECHFLCREHTGHMGGEITRRGHSLHLLPEAPLAPDTLGHAGWLGTDRETDASQTAEILATLHPDWLIVDHYALDIRWESVQRTHVRQILAIDDLADRPHDCDMLLDQNYYPDPDPRYQDLISAQCQTLLGPRFALLRPEFAHTRERKQNHEGTIRNVLVCFGGGDIHNLAGRSLAALRDPGLRHLVVNLVISPSNSRRAEIEALCSARPGTRCFAGHERISVLMAESDLALGAGGGMNWERCCLGLPSIVLAMAENQRLGTAALAKAGLVLGVVDGENVSVADIAALLKAALLSPTLLAGMSARGMALVDGRGAIRLARRLTPPNLGFRHAGPDDCMSLFHWRNHPTVRANSLQHASLDESAHRAWFARVMADPNRRLLIVEDDRAVGVLRFDLDGSGTALVSAYLVPERIGSGLGQEVLRQGIAWLRRNQPSTHRLEAEILTHNRVSEEAFRQAGFREEKFMMVWTS